MIQLAKGIREKFKACRSDSGRFYIGPAVVRVDEMGLSHHVTRHSPGPR